MEFGEDFIISRSSLSDSNTSVMHQTGMNQMMPVNDSHLGHIQVTMSALHLMALKCLLEEDIASQLNHLPQHRT